MSHSSASSITVDLVIALRIYPGISKAPAVFATDKFRLVELGLRSLRVALRPVKAHIILMLDGCPPAYERLGRDLLGEHSLEVLNLNRIGNAGTWRMQIDLLLKQQISELIYFAEDDYFYRPRAFTAMLALMRADPKADFVTVYDHPDYYGGGLLHRYTSKLCFMGGQHWRTSLSTTLSFMSRRATVASCREIFLTYCRGNWDCSIWWLLTKKQLIAPLTFARICARGTREERLILWKLMKGIRHLRHSPRRYRLWSSMPALATHLESTVLSPGVDWPEEFAAFDAEMRGEAAYSKAD